MVLGAWAGETQAGGIPTLETVEVIDSASDLVGIADTASQGTVLKQQLDSRPVYREGELLENVPGMIVSQHSGEGKANQYYLRGFNLDHGTDVAITVDDMPVNMRSHAHGQGYSDINFMIPELASGLQYSKGPYFADQGDFATAGAVHVNYLDTLDKDIAEVGGGSFGYGRGFTALSRPAAEGNLLLATEIYHLDGPWVHPDDYFKGNAVLRYSTGTPDNGWSTTAMAYGGKWNASNQAPLRAIQNGQLPYFGNENPTDGGWSQRYSLSTRMVQTNADRQIKASAYVIGSQLDLYNDFTFFLYNPNQGDQFHQHDMRLIEGGKASYTRFRTLAGFDTENTVGSELRNDDIHLGLFQTHDRRYLSTDRVDRVTESSAALYVENRTSWLEKLRSVVGLREDYFYGNDVADNPLNGGTAKDHQLNPKGSLILGPWAATEFYLSGGKGFHSNDVRSATTTVEPTTTNNNVAGISGQGLQKFPLMESVLGEEVGMRTGLVPHLQSSLALFRLTLSSEQVFNGDAGDSSPSGKSTRKGVEWANFYTPIPGIILDADLAVSQAQFHGAVSDGITTGKYIAGSPRTVMGVGIAFDDFGPWFGGLQYRFFGERPLTDDNSVRSPDTNLVNARIGYKLTEAISARLDVDNIFNQKMQDISYYYASRLGNEPLAQVGTGTNDIHMHPAEPLGLRFSLVARW